VITGLTSHVLQADGAAHVISDDRRDVRLLTGVAYSAIRRRRYDPTSRRCGRCRIEVPLSDQLTDPQAGPEQKPVPFPAPRGQEPPDDPVQPGLPAPAAMAGPGTGHRHGGSPARAAIHSGRTGSWPGSDQTTYPGDPGQVPRPRSSTAWQRASGPMCTGQAGIAVIATRGQMVTVRQDERLRAPLVPPGPCPLFVRTRCYASTHGDAPWYMA
jgi:hypothetical protein